MTIGSTEGIAHLCLAVLDKGDTIFVQNSSYPIHIYGRAIAGADVLSVLITDSTDDFLAPPKT